MMMNIEKIWFSDYHNGLLSVKADSSSWCYSNESFVVSVIVYCCVCSKTPEKSILLATDRYVKPTHWIILPFGLDQASY